MQDDKQGLGNMVEKWKAREQPGADGAMCAPGGGGSQVANPLDPFPGQYMMRSGQPCGPCVEDATWRGLETALNIRRYGQVFVNVQRSGAGDLFVAAMTANNKVVAFNAGVGENAVTTGLTGPIPVGTVLNLTRAETDGYTEGALAPDSRFDFRITGMGVQVLEPFRAASVNGDPAGRQYDPFWDTYRDKVLRALIRSSHITFRHGNVDFGFELGRPDFYPAMAGVEGSGGVNVGRPLASAFIPLRVPDFAGGPTDDDAITVELMVDRTFGIVADPLVPVPALGVGEAYLVPVTFELFGTTIRNMSVQTKADVERVARGVVAEVFSDMAESMDPNNPESVRMFQEFMRRQKARG